jgi:hypothetical protein
VRDENPIRHLLDGRMTKKIKSSKIFVEERKFKVTGEDDELFRWRQMRKM